MGLGADLYRYKGKNRKEVDFEHSGADDEYKEETLEALKHAKNAIEEGDRIYYTFWW